MVLGHQGGWDEMLFVGMPVLVFAFLLWLARTRADRELDEEEDGRPVESPDRPDT